jgi:hypothetical protein
MKRIEMLLQIQSASSYYPQNQYNYTTPCANMASATFTKPPILAPFS